MKKLNKIKLLMRAFGTKFGEIFLRLSAVLLFLLSFIQIPASAADDVEILSCIQKGEQEFGTFWRAVIYSDGLYDGTIEPFNDVIFRNSCQTNDIILLTKEQNRLRSMIREEFLKCEPADFENLAEYDVEEIDRLKKAFHEVTMEIYYVRNIVDYKVAVGLPFGVLNTQDLYDEKADFDPAIKKKANVIYNEMFEKYVSEDYSADEFNLFFSKIDKKYKDRIAGYQNCDSGSWAAVSDRWREFQEFFTEDYAGLKESSSEISASAKDLADEFKEAKLIEVLRGKSGISDFVTALGAINVNGLTPAEGFNEVLDEFLNSLPEGASITQEALLVEIDNKNNDLVFEEMEKSLKAKFEVQYLYNSDQSAELFTEELNNTLEITDNSFTNMSRVLSGVEAMDNRQCRY